MLKALQSGIKRAQEVFNKHWFKAGLFFMCFYVILHKDISFHISMQNGQVSSIPVQSAAAATVNEMSIGGAFSGLVSKIAPAEVPKAEKKIAPPKASKKDNRANHFHNISAIISPIYLKNKGVSDKEMQQMKSICKNYVKRFAPVAQSEMKKYGVPASIKLAQALLESDAGNSRLAKANNNHFGIKCFAKSCKKGHCANFTDDTHKDFFRKYSNAWESFRAHSLVVNGKRYRHLKKLSRNDYKGWAIGLKKAGYATDKRYAEKLIQIIEALQLNRFDH